MSINPVQGIGGASAEFAEASLRLGPSRPSAAGERSPDPGTSPSQEVSKPQNDSVTPELPRDEVQVQRDSETNDEIVIKYVDHSGNVILQVLSSEVLGLARAISEDLQQQAQARAASSRAAAGAGEKTHGH